MRETQRRLQRQLEEAQQGHKAALLQHQPLLAALEQRDARVRAFQQ